MNLAIWISCDTPWWKGLSMARHRQKRPGSRHQRSGRPKRQAIFYAFPSQPESLGETIQLALGDIQTNRQIVGTGLRLRPWPEMPVSGRRLLGEITDQIDRSRLLRAMLRISMQMYRLRSVTRLASSRDFGSHWTLQLLVLRENSNALILDYSASATRRMRITGNWLRPC